MQRYVKSGIVSEVAALAKGTQIVAPVILPVLVQMRYPQHYLRP